MAASEPRESPAGESSVEGALITRSHPPGREVEHIFITVAMRTISDYHQAIKLPAGEIDWLLNMVILGATSGQQQEPTDDNVVVTLLISFLNYDPSLFDLN